MKTVLFEYEFVDITIFLNKYGGMIELVEAYVENKPNCTYETEVHIGHNYYLLKIWCHKKE